jgi:DNA-binding LacI/PurR family transcriptional regulator
MARVTLKDVAARAGVSYQTVSKVLNNQASVTDETKARIFEAIRELGYRPNISARNLRTQSSNLLGYAWRQGSEKEEPHPVLDRFFYSAVQTAEANNYHLMTFLIEADENLDVEIYRELYAKRQVEGFLLADTNHDDPRVAFLIEEKIPFATFGRANEAWDFCWVDVDGRSGIYQVVDYLIQNGHERLGIITWPEGSKTGEERESGYFDRLSEAGIQFDSDWLIRGDNTVQVGAAGVGQLLELPEQRRPTAVICMSDHLAIGAMAGAASAGLQVGQDIAVTGFDDIPMSAFLHPPLTTVRQPINEVGRKVVDLLLKQINGEPLEEKGFLLEPSIIIRESA